MLSKNNHKLSNQKLSAKKQRFKIKKLSIGVASVLVGTMFATYTGADRASADTQVDPAVTTTETDDTKEASENDTLKFTEASTEVIEALLENTETETVEDT